MLRYFLNDNITKFLNVRDFEINILTTFNVPFREEDNERTLKVHFESVLKPICKY